MISLWLLYGGYVLSPDFPLGAYTLTALINVLAIY